MQLIWSLFCGLALGFKPGFPAQLLREVRPKLHTSRELQISMLASGEVAAAVVLPKKPRGPDPFDLVKTDMRRLKKRIKGTLERQVGSRSDDDDSGAHPLLQQAAKEFFERREKNFRMAVVLLVGRALQSGAKSRLSWAEEKELVMQLAEITEMMHTATVIHDDVLEDHQLANAGNVAHQLYDANVGNKVSVLAGDFLLSRSSVQLSKLKDVEVVEKMATALEQMMQGGVMQVDPLEEQVQLAHYLDKISLKTASLIAMSCQCAAMLRGHQQDSEIVRALWDYGHGLGLAYQLTRDSIVHNISALSEVQEQDMDGVATEELSLRACKCMNCGPVHFAAQQYEPEVISIAGRGVQSAEDMAEMERMVQEVDGEERTKSLAMQHAHKAITALESLPASNERTALELLVHYVVGESQKELQRPEFGARGSKGVKSKVFS